jgi:YihY family inner membrane protein
MSSATTVPETGHLTGLRAFDTMRDANVWTLLRDSVQRLRFADGFSHGRALAFQLVLVLIPGTIVLVALAFELQWGSLSNSIISTAESLAPGPTADVFREAFGQGSAAGSSRSGWPALSVAGPAMLIAGVTAFGQVERAANRIYGVEADRPGRQKYSLATSLMFSAGTLTVLYFLVIGMGSEWLNDGSGWATAWTIARWPVGICLLTVAVALMFKISPRRNQPTMSWLVVGGLISVAGCLLVSVLLTLYLTASQGFGDAYGPLAGFMGVLLWAYGSSVALLFGLSFAAQLEAVRAGLSSPRDEVKVRDSEPDAVTIPYGTAAMHPRR